MESEAKYEKAESNYSNSVHADNSEQRVTRSRGSHNVLAWLASKFTAGSIKGSIFELMVATIGSGVLVLPAAFAASGLAFSVAQLVTWAVLGYFSTMLLAECGKKANKYSYSELAEVTYGVGFQVLVKAVF